MMNTEIRNNLGIPETNEDLDRGVDVAYNDDYRKAKIRELEVKIQQLDENNKKKPRRPRYAQDVCTKSVWICKEYTNWLGCFSIFICHSS